MKNIFLIVILLGNLFARIVIEEESKAYDDVAKIAQGRVNPIAKQAMEERDRINAPLDEAIIQIQKKLDDLNKTLNETQGSLFNKIDLLRDKHKKDINDVEKSKQEELIKALSPMQDELKKKREPIMAAVSKLEEEKSIIISEYSKFKNNSRYNMYEDGYDELDINIRLGLINKSIGELFNSVDGDLPSQIEEQRKTIERKFMDIIENKQVDYQREAKSIRLQLDELATPTKELQDKITELNIVKCWSTQEFVRNSGSLIREIVDQVTMELICLE